MKNFKINDRLKFLFIILLVFLCYSCQNSKKDEIFHVVQEWKGKEIRFPSNSVFTIQGKDTVKNFPDTESKYKIVTYVDSIGCISCKLQLFRWKDFMKEVDSLAKVKISFLFYFHLKNVKELHYITRRDNFIHPICMDGKDEFNQINHFPTEMAFHTFLVDKDNKVVAIGNPIHNPKIKELYLNIILGKLQIKNKDPKTKIQMRQTHIDFGEIKLEKAVVKQFEITNIGSAPLVIYDVTTSCGCTKVKYDKRPIKSKGKIKFSVTYDGDKVGLFKKTITVYCNIVDTYIKLTIYGDVK